MLVLDPNEIGVESLARAQNLSITASPQVKVAIVKEQAFDDAFWLGSLQHPTLRLHRAIKLTLSNEDGHVVLEWPEANSLFGYGNSLSSAVTDFRFALVELYESLIESSAEELGADLITVRALLNETVGPYSAA